MKEIFPILCVFLLLGCGKSPKQQAEEQAEILLREKILHLRATHGASIDWIRELPKWDDRVFTAHFQRIFLESRKSTFLFPLHIADLVREHDGYMLVADVVYARFTHNEIKLILKCPPEIVEKILDSQMGRSHSIFLAAARIASVRNVAIELIPKLNYSPEEVYVEAESADIYIDVNAAEAVILVGECVALESTGIPYFNFVELTNDLASRIGDNR